MRRARLLIYLLLLTVPLQGLAAVMQFKQPCPMEQTMAQMNADAPHAQAMSSTAKPDCCQDDHSAAGNNSPCKPGQQCHAGQHSIAHVSALPAVAATQSVSILLKHHRYSPLALHTIWRPPLLASH
ncbi:MAG: hypothetical protein P1U67_04805 [Alcanivoracaceae bacterium]|nr:hypothetical protein [Alcanivoracaceae bacterium]